MSGTVQQCRDTVAGLAEMRWLMQVWRLRLEGDHCEWEARTGDDFVAIEMALVAPRSKWTPPAAQWASRGIRELEATVARLEAEVALREDRIGLDGRLGIIKPVVDSMHARAAPCDVAVLDRELALEQGERGKLLEVEDSRLVHPLEPRGDFRLRGLVGVFGAALLWHCPP